jgi:hypothetical protein
MFLSCSYMFQYQGHVSNQGHISISSPCLSSRFIVHFMVYYLFLGIQMVLCFYGFMYLCLYLSLFPSIQKAFIQKLHHLFVVVYVSCIILLTCVTFSLVVLLIDVLHSKVVCELCFFYSLFCKLVGKHLR